MKQLHFCIFLALPALAQNAVVRHNGVDCPGGQHVVGYNTATGALRCSADSASGNKATMRLGFYGSTLASSTTTHYFQAFTTGPSAPGNGNSSTYQLTIPVTGTIVQAGVSVYQGNAITSPSGGMAVALCINGTSGATCNGTTVSLLMNQNPPVQFSTLNSVATGLNQPTTAGDKINIDFVPGAFSTANGNFSVYVDLIIQ